MQTRDPRAVSDQSATHVTDAAATGSVEPVSHDSRSRAGVANVKRRSFLKLGTTAVAAAAGSATLSTPAEAQGPRGKGSTPVPKSPAGSRPDVSASWQSPVLRLVRRITMGLSLEEVALAKQLGYAGYLDYQLKPERIDDSAVDALIAQRLPMVSMTSAQLATQDANEAMAQLQDAALYRAAMSKRQLKERMIEFWTDHFTISLNKVGVLKLPDDRDVIRANAMTTFPQLLRATSQSAAMLVYLDQNRSSTPTPNQNYAREIMELHTVGVDGGYTQTDVAELSRILTGWSVGAGSVFQFNRNSHDRNAKTFLGRAFPAMASTATTDAMKAEGDTAITMLLTHPSTARYISWKMARWLLAYEPPDAVVDATAATYTATGGNIPAMIRTILTSDNLMASPAKYKRPFHFAVSAIRAAGPQITNIRGLRQQADRMGMPMFLWEQPNGYPDRVDWWSGLVLNRWSFTTYFQAQNSATGMLMSTAPFMVVNTAAGVLNQINARMYGGEMPATLRAQLATYLGTAVPTDARVREVIGLAIQAHQNQWY